MNQQLEQDLQRTMQLISEHWQMQTNGRDRETNFIYSMNSLDECLQTINRVARNKKDYALHRWYNFKTSKYCEEIFCDYGAVPEANPRNHDVDIFIDGVPFDVKVTLYPAKLSHRPFDLSTREGKNAMIAWFYNNQSQGMRKQMLNRLYVVCDAATGYENMVMKSNFQLMRERISAYMKDAKANGVNRITITDHTDEKSYDLQSDIIVLD